MSASIVFLVVLIGTFLLSYLTKRRFGVLGLALAAGALISEHWAGILTPFLQQQGVILVAPPLSIVVAIALTLLPAVILLFSGPAYGKALQRILGSLLFTMLAFTFVAPAIGSALEFDEFSRAMYGVVEDYRPLIIVGGLTIAIIDVFLTRSPKKHKAKKSEH